jgi:L-2-hydroxyglutarate oxidase LhgO
LKFASTQISWAGKKANTGAPAVKYWPGLKDDALQPAYAGIRPKTVPQGSPDADFQLQGPDEHGVSGLVNFYGVESPGLTASLALADLLCERLQLS